MVRRYRCRARPHRDAAREPNTLLRIRKAGKGVVRFHGTSKVTVDALDSILTGLKHDGFRVVHIVPTAPYTPNGEFMTQLALLPDSAPSSNRISRRLENAAKGPLLPSERDRRERQTAEQRRAEFGEAADTGNRDR